MTSISLGPGQAELESGAETITNVSVPLGPAAGGVATHSGKWPAPDWPAIDDLLPPAGPLRWPPDKGGQEEPLGAQLALLMMMSTGRRPPPPPNLPLRLPAATPPAAREPLDFAGRNHCLLVSFSDTS